MRTEVRCKDKVEMNVPRILIGALCASTIPPPITTTTGTQILLRILAPWRGIILHSRWLSTQEDPLKR